MSFLYNPHSINIIHTTFNRNNDTEFNVRVPQKKISIYENDNLTLTCRTSTNWKYCKWTKISLSYNDSTQHFEPHRCEFSISASNVNYTEFNSCDEFGDPKYRMGNDNLYQNNICKIKFSSAQRYFGGEWICELRECLNWTSGSCNDPIEEGSLAMGNMTVEVKKCYSPY